MKYVIQIGSVIQYPQMTKRPEQELIITQDQLALIETFANTRKDEKLRTWYKLNECEFTVLPYFEPVK